MIITTIIIFCCLIYALRVSIIRNAAKYQRNKYKTSIISDTNSHLPFVSVIVPARNEEQNIENCINSIIKSNYPKDKFTIIIVNDRSTDKTAEIINTLASINNNIKICTINTETPHHNLKGKPRAIKVGIDNATSDIIMMTDADCIVNKNWIPHIVQHFIEGKKDNIGMVCAYTNVNTKNIFHCFQAAEWAYMHTFAAAGIGLGTVMGCFGNNIAITKKAYNHIGGFEKLKFSVTEDFVILKAIHNAKFSIRYICTEDTTVETLPENTFKGYLTQRKRWAVGGTDLGWKAIAYVSSSVCLWIAIILAAISGEIYLLLFSCCLRFLGDCLILFPVFNTLKITYLKKWIPLSVCFYSVIELMLPIMIINRKVKWKDQVFE